MKNEIVSTTPPILATLEFVKPRTEGAVPNESRSAGRDREKEASDMNTVRRLVGFEEEISRTLLRNESVFVITRRVHEGRCTSLLLAYAHKAGRPGRPLPVPRSALPALIEAAQAALSEDENTREAT